MNIVAPRNVVIRFIPYAATPPAEAKLVVQGVIRALNAWYYSQG